MVIALLPESNLSITGCVTLTFRILRSIIYFLKYKKFRILRSIIYFLKYKKPPRINPGGGRTNGDGRTGVGPMCLLSGYRYLGTANN